MPPNYLTATSGDETAMSNKISNSTTTLNNSSNHAALRAQQLEMKKKRKIEKEEV